MSKKSCALLLLLMFLIGAADGAAQKWEVGAYAGGSFYLSHPSYSAFPFGIQPIDPLVQRERVEYLFADGGVFGIRARQNIWEHFGLEESWTITGTQNAKFPGYTVGTRMSNQVYLNGIFYALNSEKKIRPYLTGGYGWAWWSPTEEGQAEAAPNHFSRSSNYLFNFGAGARVGMGHRFALDFNVRDFVALSPTFDWAGATERDTDNRLEVTAGFNVGFGGGGPIIVHNFVVAPTIQASNTSLCPGDTSTLSIVATDTIPENTIVYRWTVNGQEVSMDPQFTFVAPNTAGPTDVGVRVFYTNPTDLDKKIRKAIDKDPGMPADRRTTLDVKEYKPPTVTANVDRTTVQRGQRAFFAGSAQGSACSGNLSYRWSASDGRLIAGPDAKTTEFDGSTLAFSETVQGQQCKPVTVSLDVTDQRGGVGRDSKQIQVCYTAAAPPPPPPPPPPPQPVSIQLSDINFGVNSARVNNCGKRVLANELYPQITSARYRDYDIVLIGSRASSEQEKVAKGSTSTLDRDRALQAAAFLSAKGSTCKDIELSRVKIVWEGTEQDNDFRSNFCDSTTERRRDAVSGADANAKNRRVQVWLVPKGATMPTDMTVTDVTTDIMKLGCPR